MTKNDVKTVTAQLFNRFLPEMYGTCDMCDSTPALRVPSTPWLYLCPTCQAKQALTEKAESNLELMVFPVLVAWAQQWHGAGLSRSDLVDLVKDIYFSQNSDYTRQQINVAIRAALNVEVPEYEDAPPARCTVQVRGLPTVVGTFPNGVMGRTGLLVRDSSGRQEKTDLPHGLPALLVMHLDGSALLIFHNNGEVGTSTYQKQAMVVPANLVGRVNDVLAEAQFPFDISHEAWAADD